MTENWDYEAEGDAWYILCNGRRVARLLVDEEEASLLAEVIVKLIAAGTVAAEATREDA